MKKILSLILVFSVLTSLISVVPVHANVATKYNYAFGVHTMDTEHAGTDGTTIHMGVKTYEGSEFVANYGSNGYHFDANRYDEYQFSLNNVPPWRMKEFVYGMSGDDAWDIGTVTLWLPTVDGTKNPTQAKAVKLNMAVKGKTRIPLDISDVTKRKFTDMGGVDSGGGEFYLDAESTGSIVKEWDKKVRDQYAPNNSYIQTESYDIMKYEDEPVIQLRLSDDSVGQDWFTVQMPTKEENFNLNIDRQKLYAAMAAQDKGEINLTYRLAVPAQSTHTESLGGTFAHTTTGNPEAKTYLITKIGGVDYYYKDVTYTFYRSIFDLGNENISQTATFTHATDNYYLNRELTDVNITIDALTVHKKSMTNEVKAELITNLIATPSLYLGNNKTTKLANLSMTKLLGTDGKPNGKLQFTGTVPMDVSEVESEGVRLQLDHVSSSLMKNGQPKKYLVERPDEDSIESQSFYFSTHKIDTKTPTVRMTDENGNDLIGQNSIHNNVKQKHQFYMVASETLYSQGNSEHTSTNENYFRYELYKKNGNAYEDATTLITNFDGTGKIGTVTAPISTGVLRGVSINLSPIDRTEGEFKLRLYGWDKANNPLGNQGYLELENIKLDNLAPRVTIHETVQPQDVQSRKRNDYRFEMNDYQQSNGGWSRTYYTFMKGTTLPPNTSVNDIKAGSQEISSTLGEWAFVDSKGASQTAILSIPKGDNFDGTLYTFTVDSLGNDSRNEGDSKYYTRQVQILNGSANDTIITNETSTPKKSFNIKFNTENTNLETSYRWVSHASNGTSFTQNYSIYNATHDVGSAQKRNSNNNLILFDGKYTLEYTVTNKTSGNSSSYSRDFTFDNKVPDISYVVGNQLDHFKSTHQLNVKVTDVSGIESAYYYLAEPGTERKIKNAQNNPLTLTMNSEGKFVVDQTLTMTDIPTGAYSIVVVANDLHGQESKKISPYFGIRSEAVSIVTLQHAQPKTINGMGATSNGKYNIETVLNEPHAAWTSDSTTKYQKPIYYAAIDGNPAEKGVVVSTFTATHNSGGRYAFTLDTPVPLTEGINTISLQYGLLNHPSDERSEFLTEKRTIKILYDTQAPTFELPDYSTIQPTNTSVTATIVASDVGTGISKLTVAPEYGDKITISPYANGAFTVTISENVTTNLVLSDELGNSVYVPISVSNIDKIAPTATASSEIVINGARNDGRITVNVADKSDTTAEFALVKDPIANVQLTEEDYLLFESSQSVALQTGESVGNGEGNKQKTYTIDLKGLSGTYAIGIKATDNSGNITEKVFYDSKLDLVDAEAAIKGISANPTITKTTSTVRVSFNVPVTVMPNAPIEGDKVETMARMNHLSRGLLTTSENYTMEYDVVIQNNNEMSLYVQDEAGRDKTLKFTPEVDFIEGFEITGNIEKNGTAIQNGGFISYKESDKLYYVVFPNPKYSGQFFYVENAILSGLKVNTELSVLAPSFKEQNEEAKGVEEVEGAEAETVEETGAERKAYSKLVFEALRDGNTTKSAYFEVYTAEGIEADRLEEAYVAMSVIDETAPVATVTYSTVEPTNQTVSATLSISDPQSGILKLERSTNGTSFEKIDSIVSHTERFEQNGTVYFKVTNHAGMETTIPVKVVNIDKTPITEDTHYKIEYTYENYLGNWVPITDGKAYRRVMATVKPLNSGKTLSILNNSASFSKILTAEVNSFEFALRDQFGNQNAHLVRYNNFDNTIGETSYVLSNTAKTNKNIYATIIFTDDSGEISFAEVKKGDVVYPFQGEPMENEYVVELDSSGVYYVTAYDYAGNKWTAPITVSNINKEIPIATAKTYSTLPTELTTQSVTVELTQFSKDIKTIKVTGVEPLGSLAYTDVVYIPGTKTVRFKKNGSVAMSFVDDYGNEGQEILTISNIVSTPPQVVATATLAKDKLSVDVAFDLMRDKDGVPLDKFREKNDLSVSYNGYEYALVADVKDENSDIVISKDTVIKVKKNGEHVFHVRDKTGLTQKILLTIEGIEAGAPTIKEVRWSYKYLEKNKAGQWVEQDYHNQIKIGVDTSGNEAGYIVGTDKNPITNQDVNVTVITDKDARFVGGNDVWELDKSMNYSNNGLYVFNLQGRTGEHSSYGVNVGLIDKTPPQLTLKNGEELVFIEGMTPKKDASIAYDKSKLLDFEAWDMVANKKVDLTDRVTINYGSGDRVFNPDNISANEFNRSNPYYIEYTVRDDAGNSTTIRRTIRLVGLYDTIALVNGVMPDSSNVATVIGNKIEISLKNFAGISYARYEKGTLTQGQMKTKGTVLREKDGVYTIDNVSSGWYTVYIQTDKRDYFNISVYVSSKGGK